MSYATGVKPVAHQAPIVLTARLSSMRPQNDDTRKMEDKCNREATPGMLAFTEDVSAEYSTYPEPEYYVNVNNFDNKNVSFLGIVQTPGVNGPMSRQSYSDGGQTNVIHAGGTMTTFNTGPETIPCNTLVAFDVKGGAQEDNLPREWKKYDSAHCKFAQTVKYEKGMEESRIIGRAIRTSDSGQQLDLILKY